MKTLSILFSILIFITIFAVVLATYSFYSDNYSQENSSVLIPKGAGLKSISSILEENYIVRDKRLFWLFVLLNGTENNLKAGEYEFDSDLSINEIHRILLEGRAKLISVTIPEGYTINQITEVLVSNNVVNKEEFYKLINNKDYINQKLGIEVESFEGFFFPETYYFNKNESPEVIINTMVDKFFEVYNSIENNNDLQLNLVELVTYASIIEKETGVDSERTLVSAVIRNRLKKGMRIECDPTVIYALGDKYDGRLRRKDLEYVSPYNTYVIVGLPIGPIANPGKESLHAALNPADKDYLYFVATGDSEGTHYFSSNYRSHVNAVNKYIRNRKN